MISFDIETIPNLDMIDRLPEVKPASNLKDEAKIQADINAKKEKQIESMALNPLYGKVASTGFYVPTDEIFYCATDNKEEEYIIDTTLSYLGKNVDKKIITWNGKQFDFDFLYKRAAILGVAPLSQAKKYVDRYKSELYHIDLMQEWTGFGKYESLDTVARAILNEGKIDFDVKEIPELLKTPDGILKLKEYNLHDCKLTYRLAERLGYN